MNKYFTILIIVILLGFCNENPEQTKSKISKEKTAFNHDSLKKSDLPCMNLEQIKKVFEDKNYLEWAQTHVASFPWTMREDALYANIYPAYIDFVQISSPIKQKDGDYIKCYYLFTALYQDQSIAYSLKLSGHDGSILTGRYSRIQNKKTHSSTTFRISDAKAKEIVCNYYNFNECETKSEIVLIHHNQDPEIHMTEELWVIETVDGKYFETSAGPRNLVMVPWRTFGECTDYLKIPLWVYKFKQKPYLELDFNPIEPWQIAEGLRPELEMVAELDQEVFFGKH